MSVPAMWPHQTKGLDFLRSRKGAVLAFEMGTAKTRIALERIRDLALADPDRTGRKSVLILCPKKVIPHWPAQAARWLPDVDLCFSAMDKGSTERRLKDCRGGAQLAQKLGQVHVVVLNYEVAQYPKKALWKWIQAQRWSMVIADESQAIKSHSSAQSKSIGRLDALTRYCLTGTPTPHSPLDWFGQMRFLRGELRQPMSSRSALWARWTTFKQRFAVEQNFGTAKGIVGYQNLEELERRVAPYVLRVRAKDVLTLPDVKHSFREVRLSKAERKAHDGVMDDLFADIGDGMPIVAQNVLDKLLKCQQITGGSVLLKDPETGERSSRQIGTSKRDEFEQVLSEFSDDEPIVAFGLFKADLAQMRAASESQGRRVFEVSGAANEWQAFQDSSGGDVCIVQLSAGGAGIELFRASKCIYWSIGFDNGDFSQSLKRCHRPGQTDVVQYIYLVAERSIDAVVHRAIRKRRNLVEASLEHIRNIAERPVPARA